MTALEYGLPQASFDSLTALDGWLVPDLGPRLHIFPPETTLP